MSMPFTVVPRTLPAVVSRTGRDSVDKTPAVRLEFRNDPAKRRCASTTPPPKAEALSKARRFMVLRGLPTFVIGTPFGSTEGRYLRLRFDSCANIHYLRGERLCQFIRVIAPGKGTV